MKILPRSAASERNSGPILEVLKEELANCSAVLEIGSGTGQHAVHFARSLPHLVWHTSDLAENHAAITAWLEHAALANTRPPLELDVEQVDANLPPVTDFDAAFSANTAHIMRMEAVAAMFGLVGRWLPAGGVFCLYGPFRFDGEFTSESNAAFDHSLRQRDPAMGIRDILDLDRFADRAGVARRRLYAMPANNHLAVWSKQPTAAGGAKSGRRA